MFAMSGASLRHSLIAGNLLWRDLRRSCAARACEVVHERPSRQGQLQLGCTPIPTSSRVCGEVQLEDDHFDTLLNPTVIVEVLSESTEAYDRGEKFAHYRRLETLREYVLVAQDKIRVEHFRREGEEWILSEVSGPDATLHLASIDCHVAVAAIYEKVEFNRADRANVLERGGRSRRFCMFGAPCLWHTKAVAAATALQN